MPVDRKSKKPAKPVAKKPAVAAPKAAAKPAVKAVSKAVTPYPSLPWSYRHTNEKKIGAPPRPAINWCVHWQSPTRRRSHAPPVPNHVATFWVRPRWASATVMT